jgi:hypothetical protein
MPLLSLSAPTLAVALIFCIWQRYCRFRLQHERTLSERVTYMLWTLANRFG